MDSLVAQSTGKLVAFALICVALTLWTLAIVTNFRGYRDRNFRRSLAVGDRARRLGVPTTPWSSEEQRTAVLKAVQLVVVWIMVLALTALSAFVVTAVVIKLTR